ncbi:MAG: DUF3857 and transglutaminase domain-containing protein [Acidobacteriia bacterium]|nr:DUF3857 and transglutaminase domain-containing protein [Terriglobia bacterium]
MAPLFAADWTPVDPADLAAKSPKVEKDAHAEAILWEVRVSDEATGAYPHSVFTHYLKIKVFDERGAELVSKVDIPYVAGVSVSRIEGRTTKPDGSVIELKKDAVFDRMLVKVSGLKLKAKSFVLPGVEPGAVVEYRWYERYEERLANYVELQFQRDIPVQTVRYYLKPLSNPYFPYSMRTMGFHLPPGMSFAKEQKGFSSLTATNMPAFHEEPYMPPEHEVTGWMLVYYAENKQSTPDKYWKDHGRELYQDFKARMKVDGEVKKTAQQVMEDASAPEEKLRRLFRYCRNSIKNVNDSGSGLSVEERSDRKQNKVPADTIRAGMGTGLDIDLLFGALATAAGFDARFSKMADRSQFFFSPELAQAYFLRAYEVAVKVNDHWSFFDPASTYVPFGMLRWQEEGTAALITDPSEPQFITTPLSEPAKSLSKRSGSFRLSDAGTLEGDVHIEYTGHAATSRRRDYQEQQEEQQQDQVQKMLSDQYGGAEVTAIRVENAADPDKPLLVSYHIKVPDYAQRTGKRLFLPIAFFQRNLPAKFSASERKYPVYFSYPWMESDQISVELPEGYELEHPELPPHIPLQSIGNYKLGARYDTAKRTLICTRELIFGNEGHIVFPVSVYSGVKKAFDLMHQSDEHVLTLKQAQPVASQ